MMSLNRAPTITRGCSERQNASAPYADALYDLPLLRSTARWCYASHGDDALRQLCEAGGVQREWFEEKHHWVSWQQFEAVLAAARALVASDEEFSAINVFDLRQVNRGLRLLFWAATPSLVFRRAERLGRNFSTVGRFKVVHISRHSARLRWISACPESRLLCLARKEAWRLAPTWLGLPPAHVREHKCISWGDDCCDYEFHFLNCRRALPVLLGCGVGLGAIAAVASAYPLPAALRWLLPLLGATAGYLYGSWRVERANSATQGDVADSLCDVMAEAAEAHHKAATLEERLGAAGRAAARGGTLVGRQRELATLADALQDASAGHVRLILISGESGIGKTRLAEELAEDALRRGARMLVGRCHQGEGAPPLWPWVQILRSAVLSETASQLSADLGEGTAAIAQLIPDLAHQGPADDERLVPDPNQARFLLFDAVGNFLQRLSARQVLVVVLDDLQWAHRPTLLLLRFLVAQIRSARLLLIGIYGSDDLSPGDSLTQLLPDLVREPGCESVALSGLTREQVAPLIAGIAGTAARGALVDAVYGITEGNPFFTREVVRLLASEGNLQIGGGAGTPRISLPQSVREVVRRRLGRLSADCNQLLEVGAVLGRDFALDRAGRVATLHRARLLEVTEEALAARVIRAAAERERVYSFAHAVIREALYEGISASRRAEIHGRIAIALEQSTDEESAGLVELAHHYSEAANAGGSLDKAIEYSRRAADAALHLAAYEDAVRLYQRALGLLANATLPDKRLRCELLLALGEAQMRGGDASGARQQSLEAAALARRLGLHEQFANAALGFGWWFRIGVVDEERIALLTEALGHAGEDDGALRSKLMARLAAALYWMPDARERRAELSAEAVAMARRINDSGAIAFALNSRLYAVWGQENANLRLTAARELLQLAEVAGDRELALRSRQWIIPVLMELGDVDAAYGEMAVHARQADALHEPCYLWFAAVWRTMRALLEGRFNEVEALAAGALALGFRAEPENAQATYAGQILWLRRDQGRLDEFVEAMRANAREHATLGAAYGYGLALAYADLGRESDARLVFDGLLASGLLSLQRDLPLAWQPAIAAATEVCCFLNDPHASELYELLLPFAGNVIVVGLLHTCHGAASRYLGLLATTLRRWRDAEEHFTGALDMLERLRARPLLARTQHDFARMLVARNAPGDRARSLQLLGSVLETARELGMQSLLATALALQADVRTDMPATAADDCPASMPALAAGTEDSREGDALRHDRVFRREGDYWSIAWKGSVSRLRDAKGMHYVAQLLRHPSREFHARELVALAADTAHPARMHEHELRVCVQSDAGPVLDAKAKADYKHRLGELRAELEEAERFNDPGRVNRARGEMELITDQLAAATGLGGRDRVVASDAERARVAVTKRIKASLVKIRQINPDLGHHLTAAITTGYFCCYAPTVDTLTSWLVG